MLPPGPTMPLKRLVPPASEPVPVARGMLVRDTVPTGYKVMRTGAPHGCKWASASDRSTLRSTIGSRHERASGDDVAFDFNAHIRGVRVRQLWPSRLPSKPSSPV